MQRTAILRYGHTYYVGSQLSRRQLKMSRYHFKSSCTL